MKSQLSPLLSKSERNVIIMCAVQWTTASPSQKSMALKYLASHQVSINTPMIQWGLFINPILLSYNSRIQFSLSDVFTLTQLLTVNRESVHSLAHILWKWLAQSNTDATPKWDPLH